MKPEFSPFAERPAARAPRQTAIVAFVCFGAAMVVGAAEPLDPSVTLEDAGPEKFGKIAEQITGRVCASACHGWDMVFGGPRQTPAQWDFVVTEMVSRGALATPEEEDLIRRFLKWAWGSVWINTASADDLVAVLGISESDAKAVVAYRMEYGEFADMESLKQVPGIEVAAIEDQAAAILFN